MYKKKNIARLFASHPTIYGMLRDAHDLISARQAILGYITEKFRKLSQESQRQEPLEYALQNQCLLTIRKILSVRSERLVKYSLLKLLWNLAHEKYDDLPEDLSDGFFEEMIRLFNGLHGRSGIYDQERYPEFAKKSGREASILRSQQLDKMGDMCLQSISRYPTGLEENIKEIRIKNRKRIINHYQASEEDWNDFHWHLRHVIRDSSQLEALIHLKPEEKEAIDRAKKGGLPFGITPYYVSLMDRESHRKRDHAVRAQVIPPMDYVEAMLAQKDSETHSFDFMLENETSPIDLITRRYPSIVILKPYNSCSQICVYCQRNWEISDVMAPKAMASKKQLDAAFRWLKKHKAITEVLVTGGDPLVMSDSRLDAILSRLAAIDHILRIRIGSRIPVVLPQRITENLMDVIAKHRIPGKRTIAMVTHFEHTYEITPEAMEAVQKFRRRGISVYNQTVFTIENSRRFELAALRRMLRMIGVEPYYTFNTKGKEETKSYRVPMARLRQEVKEEARLLPGLIRTDEPVYNVPGLGKNYLRAQQHHTILSILPDGRRIYEFHPWEKNLQLADTFIDTDVSISDYLAEMKKRGEDPEDYSSIWYYF